MRILLVLLPDLTAVQQLLPGTEIQGGCLPKRFAPTPSFFDEAFLISGGAGPSF